MAKVTVDTAELEMLVGQKKDVEHKKLKISQLESQLEKLRRDLRESEGAFREALAGVDEHLALLLDSTPSKPKPASTSVVGAGTGKGNRPQPTGSFNQQVLEHLQWMFGQVEDGEVLTLKKKDKQDIADEVGVELGDVNSTIKECCLGQSGRGPKTKFTLKDEYQS